MQESMYVIYTPQSTEHDLEEILSKQESLQEAELGEVFWALKEELEIE